MNTGKSKINFQFGVIISNGSRDRNKFLKVKIDAIFIPL